MYHPTLFKNKIALITGGRSGIGYAIAKQMLQLGATVFICSRKEDLLAQAAKELSEFGRIFHHPCDIRQTTEIQKLAAFIQKETGKLDILINNAGGQFPSPAEQLSDKGWNAVLNNNLNGTFYVTREIATAFFIPQQEGTIVNITAQVRRGIPGFVHTSAARAAVENMTKTLVQEWGKYNIRVNCLAPGMIRSSGLDSYPEAMQQMFQRAKEVLPSRRIGRVEDVSNAVCFLASELSSYINGTTILIDGAQHLQYDNMGALNAITE